MKTYVVGLLALCTVLCASKALGQENYNKQLPMVHMTGLLRLVETIPLSVDGWMDHLTVDLKNQHLFISGEEAKSFVVVDLRAGKVIHETKGLGGNPRKPFFDPKTNLVWVDLGDNTVVALDASTYEVTKTVELSGGKGAAKRTPDNAAYDPVAGLYYAGVGTSGTMDGSIDVVDTKAAKLIASIKVNGSGPDGIALDAAGKRLYVGMGDVVNGESICKVIDTDKRQVIAEWPITGGPQPHVAALDAEHHRLFMGSRLQGGHQGEPGKLVVMNTDTGKVVQVLDSVGGADELFYDAPTGRIYFSGTTGTIAVFKERDPDHYALLGKVPTGILGKSGLWIPELKRYYAAVPRHTVITPPHMTTDLITEDAHLMVLEYVP